MKHIKSLNDLKRCNSNVQKFMQSLITATQRATYLEFQEPLDDYLGSDFYIVETEEDLKDVKGVNLAGVDGSLVSVADDVVLVDDAELLRKDADADTEYLYFFLSTHDAGGESHFIPRLLWNSNILETYRRLVQPANDLLVVSTVVENNLSNRAAAIAQKEALESPAVAQEESLSTIDKILRRPGFLKNTSKSEGGPK